MRAAAATYAHHAPTTNLIRLALRQLLTPPPPPSSHPFPVFTYEDWKAEGASEVAVKAAGKYHTKGKLYEVQDGDVCFFKIGQGS